MTTFTWDNALSAIREGKQSIPVAPNGIPVVAVHAPLYELMELMEAVTTGYNALVLRAADDQKRIERLRKMAQAAFPGGQAAPADGWISVDDMLPPKSGEYFTYGSASGVYPLSYSAKHKAFNAYDCQEVPEHAIREVTHWYPRPMPPVPAPATPATEEG